jgi:DNA-binding beta-propeller fold protein YncE
VTNGVPPKVYVLNASSGALLKTIIDSRLPIRSSLEVFIFQPGKTILISDFISEVIEVSESSYATTAELGGGVGPAGVAVNRNTGRIYVAELDTDTVNVYSY